MLTQLTKCDKLCAAVRLWASINLIIVARATQVLIELRERSKCRIAQKALVCVPIPRELRCPRRRRGRCFVPTQWLSDVVICVNTDDEPIQLFARHARRAGARLEVVRKCGGRDERLDTAAAGTAVFGRLVELGIQVMTEVALALEVPFAAGAVGVHVAVVFLELCVLVEILLIMRFRRFICPVGDEQRERPTSSHCRQAW